MHCDWSKRANGRAPNATLPKPTPCARNCRSAVLRSRIAPEGRSCAERAETSTKRSAFGRPGQALGRSGRGKIGEDIAVCPDGDFKTLRGRQRLVARCGLDRARAGRGPGQALICGQPESGTRAEVQCDGWPLTVAALARGQPGRRVQDRALRLRGVTRPGTRPESA